jgi:hypothetical protein
MALNRYDHVDFFSLEEGEEHHKKVCTVSYIDGKLVFTGEKAAQTEKDVNDNDYLKPFFKIGPYAVLERLQCAFQGTYFHATDIVEASVL